jgi:anti-sigma B factor antagonist
MDSPAPLEIHTKVEADKAELTVAGELDLGTATQLECAVQAALSRGPRELVIDLSKLTFMDSTGLRLFIAMYDEAAENGWTLQLLHPRGETLRIFEISGTDEHLPLVKAPG